MNIEDFLRNIPNQITEARRQLFCDSINVVEFIQRRLEDSLYVVNILLQRAIERIDATVDKFRQILVFWCLNYSHCAIATTRFGSEMRI
jgi:hypothetical protein